MRQYQNEYRTMFAVREYKGKPALMCKPEGEPEWKLSGVLAAVRGEAETADDLQEVLDEYAKAHDWSQLNGIPEWAEDIVSSFLSRQWVKNLPGGFSAKGFKDSYEVKSSAGGTCGDGFTDTAPGGIRIWKDGKHDVRYTWAEFVRRCKESRLEPEKPLSAVHPTRPENAMVYKDPTTGRLYRVGPEPWQNSYWVYYMDPGSSTTWKRCPYSSLHAGNDTQEGEEEYLRLNAKRNGWEPVEVTEWNKDAKDAQSGAAAATMDKSAAAPEPQTPATKADAGGLPAPASPADAGAATQSLSAAEPVSLAADADLPAFDYSGLDDQTVADLHLAEREYMGGRKLAEMGLRRMADGVAIAHDALCVTIATKCRTGDGAFTASGNTFGRWCESMGLNRKAAERLLQVSKLMDNSSPREQKVLEELSPSLLYAASKPSAPAELVQAVKDGDITTHKQYQDLLARYNAEKAANKSASALLAEEQQRRQQANEGRLAAEKKMQQYREIKDAALETVKQQREKTAAADARAQAAEKELAEARKERDGARDALQAAKLRGDRLKAENDDLKARPIEAAVADEDEIARRTDARLQEALAARQAEQREIAARNAEDAILLLGRQINTAWQMVRPFLSEMDEARRIDAVERINREWAQNQKEIMQCL